MKINFASLLMLGFLFSSCGNPDNTIPKKKTTTNPPIIKFYGSNPTKIKQNTHYTNGLAISFAGSQGTIGYTVSGLVDTSTPGEYILTYRSTNNKKEESIKKRRVVVEEDHGQNFKEPKVSFIGDSRIQVELGATFIDPGCSAKDYNGNKLTVASTNNVDTSKEGSYWVECRAEDNQGVNFSKLRVVDVFTPIVYETQIAGPDPLYHFQWNLQQNFYGLDDVKKTAGSNIDLAWKKSEGKGVKVAVIDFGFDILHEDIRNNIIATYNANTLKAGVAGTEGDPFEWHGTAVASIIAASSDNSVGIKGVAPKAKLILIKLESESGNGFSEIQLERAFDFAVKQNADIINCSWGSYKRASDKQKDMIDRARRSGITVVFGAGNRNINHDNYVGLFSDLDSVIGVGASNEQNGRAFYSDYGSKIDVVAPAGDNYGILSADVSGDDGYSSDPYANGKDYKLSLSENYHLFAGTSAAAPMVSGMIALLKSAHPELSEDQVYERVTSSTIRVDGPSKNATSDILNFPEVKDGETRCVYKEGKSLRCGYGKLDASLLLD